MDTSFDDGFDDSLEYWLSRPVEERIRALERLRRLSYGDTAASGRLQRILEVVRLADLDTLAE